MSRTYRNKYTKSKAIDKSCRGKGNCPVCSSNRRYSIQKSKQSTDSQLEEYNTVLIDKKVTLNEYELKSALLDYLNGNGIDTADNPEDLEILFSNGTEDVEVIMDTIHISWEG